LTILDAYALIAFLVGGPASAQVRGVLREGDAAVTSTNLAETLDVSQRVYGLPISRAMETLDPLLDDLLTTIPLDAATAQAAAEMRSKHYHRSRRPISLADAVLLASAKPDRRIATADPDVLAAAKEEAIETIELPGQG
jgi:predicted nucleic acid-binding protein